METLETEDQEWERLKAWWKRNGGAVIAGVVIGTAVVFGTNWWRNYRNTQAEGASALYEQMMIQYSEKHAGRARAHGERLLQEYPDSAYAGMAALYLARMAYETGDRKTAEARLRWAMDEAGQPAVRHAARLRLAWLRREAGDGDGARALLAGGDRGGFATFYAELEGDLAAAAGRRDRARARYRAALDARAPDMATAARILGMKLDDLGEEESAP